MQRGYRGIINGILNGSFFIIMTYNKLVTLIEILSKTHYISTCTKSFPLQCNYDFSRKTTWVISLHFDIIIIVLIIRSLIMYY